MLDPHGFPVGLKPQLVAKQNGTAEVAITPASVMPTPGPEMNGRHVNEHLPARSHNKPASKRKRAATSGEETHNAERCNMCKSKRGVCKRRGEIGHLSLVVSQPLQLSKHSWSCSKCTLLNLPNRSKCGACGTKPTKPKPDLAIVIKKETNEVILI